MEADILRATFPHNSHFKLSSDNSLRRFPQSEQNCILEAVIQKRFHAQMFASLGKDDKNALEYLESILFARVVRPPYTLNRKLASMPADRPRSRG
ncbi:hypothetical protein Egran_00843 [Elaphomyces granulatus]|uniref:Uncharacterized protein n=1 Tax=Elaphomyces granulatus TaxID=519963 RepID=A0A232M4Y7_9EURO|nr:hypothetical protein Egran_00843 [Elaphomyces granulatus]